MGDGYVGANCRGARYTLLMSLAEAKSANFHAQLSPFAKMAHGLLLAIPKARLFVTFSFSERDAYAMIFIWVIDAAGTIST